MSWERTSHHRDNTTLSRCSCNSEADSRFIDTLEGGLGNKGGLKDDGMPELGNTVVFEGCLNDERLYFLSSKYFCSCNLAKSRAGMRFSDCSTYTSRFLWGLRPDIKQLSKKDCGKPVI